MNNKIIYLKQVTSYDDILKKEKNKLPLFLKKIVFLYKNIFNIITKKNIDDYEVWILPITENCFITKIEKKLIKCFKNSKNSYLLSNELSKNSIFKIMDEQSQKYVTEEKIKKLLLKQLLEYITNIRKKDLNNLNLTILVNNTSEINMYLIEQLAKTVKVLKIVSLNIYKFRKIEGELYNNFGIAIQFSNSYKKSLEKSEIIVNLDFNEIEINEYEINNNAIIINCIDSNIKLKSKLFNGIIINSCDVDFNIELVNKFKRANLYSDYKKILLYSSLIENENNIANIQERMVSDKLVITALIGNNGKISKKEFKNVGKKLDKSKK